ncbi:zinc-ribbon domain-containing protein [Neoasaia chiangmaiensis]|nr:zinc-ribbon domain-containing protein [Neoasaia chiangmaiensis]
MRITCPECAATYEVPAERLMTAQRLKCASCGARWTIELPLAATAAEPQDVGQGPGDKDSARPEPLPVDPAVVKPPLRAWDPVREREPVLAEPDRPRAPLIAQPDETETDVRASRSLFWPLAWVASFFGLALAITGIWHWQSWIAAEWPPSARLFTYCAHLTRIA